MFVASRLTVPSLVPCFALAAMLSLAVAHARGDCAPGALQQRGLVQQNERWLLPLDIEMQQHVRELPKMEANLIASRNSFRRLAQSLIAANGALRNRLERAERNVQILKAGRAVIRSEGRRKLVDARIEAEQEQLGKLRNAWTPPDEIAAQPAMRRAIIHLTNSRNELAANILWIHDTRTALREGYEELAQDVEIQAAIERLPTGHKIGSVDEYDSKAFLRKLADYEQQVFTDELPLYVENGELRVAAFINRTPVTFTWHTSKEPTMLTASVIEATGLKVPDDAPEMKRRFADGQELTVRQIEVPYLRFGRHVLKDVAALALPPEGERYGAQIGDAAFEENAPRAEPANMRLVFPGYATE